METPTLVVAPPQTVEQIRQIAEMLPRLFEKVNQTEAENVALKMGIQHYTKTEAAVLLGFGPRQIEKFVAEKRLIAVNFSPDSKSKDFRFTYAEIKRFSDAHQIQTPDYLYTTVIGRKTRR